MTSAVRDRLNLPIQMVKAHLKVDYDYDDALIQTYVLAAMEEADLFLNNDFDSTRESVGRGDAVTKTFSVSTVPAYKIRSIKINGGRLSESAYTFDAQTGVITFVKAPPYGENIVVEYEARFPIPEAIREWVLNRTAFKYEHRTDNLATETDSAGTVTWAKDDFVKSPLWRFRKNPGF